MAYAVVRTDKMIGTDVRSELVSVRYQPGDTFTEIENGNVVKLGSLEKGSREIYKGLTPTATDKINDIVLVASPEVMYDERKRNLDEFINEEKSIARGYRLHEHDIFSVTKEALDGVTSPAIGNVVELKAGTKLNVATAATSGSTQVGEIIDINIVGRYTYYVIEVV